MYYSIVLMCIGSSCQSNNSIKLVEYLKNKIKDKKINEYVKVYSNGCLGTCQKGPSMIIIHGTLGLIRYVHIDNEKIINRIIDETLIKGELIKEYYIEQHIRED